MKENYRFPRKAPSEVVSYDTSEIQGRISDFGSLTIRMVRFGPDEALWDHLVDKYHYFARPWIVGSYLKYIAYLDGRPVACLGWGSTAWKVACRDQMIGWDPAARESNLHKVINNVRFLILPWVHIEHLASKALAPNIRVLSQDWLHFYHAPVVLLETFVDTQRFAGACYRAANWRCVGKTKGRGKYDRRTRCLSSVKTVFLYPLNKNYRELLNVFDFRGTGRPNAFDLYRQGIVRMKDVPSETLGWRQKLQLDGLLYQKNYIDKKAVKAFLDSLWFPLCFMDFETTYMVPIPLFDNMRPYEQLPFQVSLHVIKRNGEEPVHHAYLAKDMKNP